MSSSWYLLQSLLALRTQLPLCIWPVFLFPQRPGSDFDEQDSEQCAYPGEQLSRGSRDLRGHGRLKGHSEYPTNSLRRVGYSWLCLRFVQPLKILPSKWTRAAYWAVSPGVHPDTQATFFSSLHLLPTEPLYSLQGIPSFPWCLCFVNIYRLLSCPSCPSHHSAGLHVLRSFNFPL